MIAALNFGALALGVAAGGLAASVIGLVLSGTLTLAGLEEGPEIGVLVGVVIGLAVGGLVAGWKARHSFRFHGSVTGLLLSFLIVIIARLGGSPASTAAVLWLTVLAVVVGGLAGWLAGRRKGVNG